MLFRSINAALEEQIMQAVPKHFASIFGAESEAKLTESFKHQAVNYIVQGNAVMSIKDADGKVLKGGTA